MPRQRAESATPFIHPALRDAVVFVASEYAKLIGAGRPSLNRSQAQIVGGLEELKNKWLAFCESPDEFKIRREPEMRYDYPHVELSAFFDNDERKRIPVAPNEPLEQLRVWYKGRIEGRGEARRKALTSVSLSVPADEAMGRHRQVLLSLTGDERVAVHLNETLRTAARGRIVANPQSGVELVCRDAEGCVVGHGLTFAGGRPHISHKEIAVPEELARDLGEGIGSMLRTIGILDSKRGESRSSLLDF